MKKKVYFFWIGWMEWELIVSFLSASFIKKWMIHFFNYGMIGYMLSAQPSTSTSLFHSTFNQLHQSNTTHSLIKEERIRAASLFAGAKPKEGKKDGMELLKKEWNGIPLRQRGLRPITHHIEKEEAANSKERESIIKEKSEVNCRGPLSSLLASCLGAGPPAITNQKKKKWPTPSAAPATKEISFSFLLLAFSLAYRAGLASLGRRSLTSFHWRSFAFHHSWMNETKSKLTSFHFVPLTHKPTHSICLFLFHFSELIQKKDKGN